MPDSIDRQYYGQISTTGAKPFVLKAKIHPTDTEMATCRFYADTFLPDYRIPARVSRIKLLKGAAVQLSRPINALRLINVDDGIFLSKDDYVVFLKMYHTNLIGEPEPYPTEFLVMREEDLVLTLPSGATYDVTFADTPTIKPVRLQRGEWCYTLQCKFRIIPTQDEQEEI